MLCCIFIPNIFSNCIFYLFVCNCMNSRNLFSIWLIVTKLFVLQELFSFFFSKQIFTNKQTTFSIILCKKVWGRPCCIFISKPEFIASVFATAKYISEQHNSFPSMNFAKDKNKQYFCSVTKRFDFSVNLTISWQKLKFDK